MKTCSASASHVFRYNNIISKSNGVMSRRLPYKDGRGRGLTQRVCLRGGCGHTYNMPAKASRDRRSQEKDSVEECNAKLEGVVCAGKARMVKKLITSGADPNHRSRSDETMLTLAISDSAYPSAVIPVLSELVSSGADINGSNGAGFTPLMIACKRGSAEVVKWLADQGCSLTVEDGEGNSALSLAALEGRTDAVRFLVQEYITHGYDIDRKNMMGLTPLLLASQNGHVDAARVLVCEGNASTKIRDLDNFMTAKDWMQSTTIVPPSEIAFLSTPRRRANQSFPRSIKVLSDYLGESAQADRSSPNVFKFQHHSTSLHDPTRASRSHSELTFMKVHDNEREVSGHKEDMPVQSMFELPKLKPSKSTAPLRDRVPLQKHHEVPHSRDMMTLFDSPFLTKRRSTPTKYIPNRRSHGLATGSLKPLGTGEPKKQSPLCGSFGEGMVRAGGNSAEVHSIRHKPLPPIKKDSLGPHQTPQSHPG